MTSPSMTGSIKPKAGGEYNNPLQDPMIDLHIRVGRLEDAFLEQKDRQNAMQTDLSLMKQDIGYIKAGLDKIYAGLNRVLWALALAVLAAASAFVLNGGLITG